MPQSTKKKTVLHQGRVCTLVKPTVHRIVSLYVPTVGILYNVPLDTVFHPLCPKQGIYITYLHYRVFPNQSLKYDFRR